MPARIATRIENNEVLKIGRDNNVKVRDYSRASVGVNVFHYTNSRFGDKNNIQKFEPIKNNMKQTV